MTRRVQPGLDRGPPASSLQLQPRVSHGLCEGGEGRVSPGRGLQARVGTRQLSWERPSRTRGTRRRQAGGLGLCWTPHSPAVVTEPAFVCLSKQEDRGRGCLGRLHKQPRGERRRPGQVGSQWPRGLRTGRPEARLSEPTRGLGDWDGSGGWSPLVPLVEAAGKEGRGGEGWGRA